MILKLFVQNFLSITVSLNYNNNDSHISLACSRSLNYLAVHGRERKRGSIWNAPNISTSAADEPVDMRTNEPTGRCATFAISYSAGSHRCV
jgi:hypothetical protein